MINQFDEAVMDETVFLIPDAAKLTNASNNPIYLEGKTNNPVLFIYKPIGQDDIAGSLKEMLMKMISALKLKESDIVLMKYTSLRECSYLSLQKNIAPSSIILFGITPPMISFHANTVLYTHIAFKNSTLIFSDALETLETNVSKRKMLWEGLQKMFSIN